MQLGFYFDQTRCTGCFTCLIACKEWHDFECGPVDYRTVVRIETGKYPNPHVANLTLSCLHCAHPACAEACPVNAINKRQDGVVLVDRKACLGNAECPGFCKDACPYDIPSFGSEPNAKMQMCDLCVGRLSEGKRPICVDACSFQALEVAPMTELINKHGEAREAEGFQYSQKTKPSIVFNPKST